MPVIEHDAINQIAAQATPEQIGKSLKKVLADRLRITGGDAGRRIADAEMLGRRAAMTGEPLAPLWSATASGQRAGVINADHVKEIRRFFAQLPCWVDESTRERVEEKLAEQAAKVRPDARHRPNDACAEGPTAVGYDPRSRLTRRLFPCLRSTAAGSFRARPTPRRLCGLHIAQPC